MHGPVSLVLEAVRHLDVGQGAHAASAAIALYFGRKYPPPMRLALWACSAAVFAGLGAAGFYWGAPGLPTLATAGVDPHLFRPIPGLVELGTADHVVQLLLGAVFGAAACVEAAELYAAPVRARLAGLAARCSDARRSASAPSETTS